MAAPAKNDDVYLKALFRGLRPDPILKVSEWADRHRRLSSKSSAEPGQWRTSRTPYLREPMDCLSAKSNIEEVVFMAGAQVGKTETGSNWVGYTIDQSPGPMMIVQPTVDLAKRYSKQRLEPLIEESPRLKEKVSPARERDSGNTVLSKEFAGGIAVMTGANSSVGLRSMPVKNLFLDEIDAYPGDVDSEGDPVSLAIARTRTFARRKILMTSTPTIEGRSRITAAFKESDQRYYNVPCPHCGHFQVLKFDRLKWDTEPSKPYYVCELNGCMIEEHHKTKMLAEGKWVPKNPGAKNGKTAGFHISSLYSPVGWFSWGEIVELFLKSKSNPDRLRAFVNTVLGEPWQSRGDAPDWEKIYRRRERYPVNVLPDGVLFITAGVDVQADRLECEIVGWGKDLETWSIDYRVLVGSTSTDVPWDKLKSILTETFEGPNGINMPIRMLAVDSGYNTQFVYNWVRQFPSNRVVAIKGQDALPSIVGSPRKVDINFRGKRIERGLLLWPAGVSIAKTELFGFLKQELPIEEGAPAPYGYCHFPEYSQDYFKGLTAEQLVTRRTKNGFTRQEWEKVRERNEPLDTRIYARVAASILGVDRLKPSDWEKIAKQNIAPAVIETNQDNTDVR